MDAVVCCLDAPLRQRYSFSGLPGTLANSQLSPSLGIDLSPRKLPDTRHAAFLLYCERGRFTKIWPASLNLGRPWRAVSAQGHPTVQLLSLDHSLGCYFYEHSPINLLPVYISIREMFPRKSNLRHREFNNESVQRKDWVPVTCQVLF